MRVKLNFILFFLLTISVFSLFSGTSFVLKDNAFVFDKVVKMKDVALMDKETKNKIGDLIISSSPNIGEKIIISKKEIYNKLIGNGFSDPVLRGALSVLIRRNGKSISTEFFKDKIHTYIKKYSKWKDGLSIKIMTTKNIVIPESGVKWEIMPVNGQDFYGNILFKVRAFKNENEIFSDWIVARLKIVKTVAVANRTLSKNELIGKDDIRWEKREITPFIKNAVFNPDLIIGKRSGRTIRTNTVITVNNLGSEYLVRRGYVSSLIVNFKSIRAVADVIPMSNGKYGDMIKVLNKSTKKVLTAMVIGQNKMEVKIR